MEKVEYIENIKFHLENVRLTRGAFSHFKNECHKKLLKRNQLFIKFCFCYSEAFFRKIQQEH